MTDSAQQSSHDETDLRFDDFWLVFLWHLLEVSDPIVRSRMARATARTLHAALGQASRTHREALLEALDSGVSLEVLSSRVDIATEDLSDLVRKARMERPAT